MIKILVIEDEKRVADLLKIGLEENGYQVLVAYDGEMGWRLFQSAISLAAGVKSWFVRTTGTLLP